MSATESFRLPEWVLRADHTIKQNNTLSFSMFYRFNDPEERQVDYGPPDTKSATKFKSQHYTFADTWSFGARMVNEFRFGYQRTWESRKPILGDIPWDSVGIPYPQLHPGWTVNYTGTFTGNAWQPNYVCICAANTSYEGRDVYRPPRDVFIHQGKAFHEGGDAARTPQLYSGLESRSCPTSGPIATTWVTK